MRRCKVDVGQCSVTQRDGVEKSRSAQSPLRAILVYQATYIVWSTLNSVGKHQLGVIRFQSLGFYWIPMFSWNLLLQVHLYTSRFRNLAS